MIWLAISVAGLLGLAHVVSQILRKGSFGGSQEPRPVVITFRRRETGSVLSIEV